ncbi:MAG TPA: hypothetical protein VGP82_12840 [Ktedonobacterales bacterium]|nr:hypothetical protein [Ktedonobacterales bacterium]
MIRPLFFAEKILFVPFILEGFAVLQGSRFHVVSVDDRSIHWRRPGSRQQAELLPWREAKVFVVVRESAKSACKSTSMLLAADTTFAWDVLLRAWRHARSQ